MRDGGTCMLCTGPYMQCRSILNISCLFVLANELHNFEAATPCLDEIRVFHEVLKLLLNAYHDNIQTEVLL